MINIINRKYWKWIGYAGHFCCAYKCKFILATEIGDVLISTVGDMHNDYYDNKMIKVSKSYFETIVFNLSDKYYDDNTDIREPYYNKEVDCDYYDDAISARNGHMNMCKKWAKLQ